MRIVIDDDMSAYAVEHVDGRRINVTVEVFEDDTITDLISRATDKLSEVYLDMCSPLM